MRSEKRRLAALAASIIPRDPLHARLSSLTNVQRQDYEQWRALSVEWHKANPDGAAYALMLDGYVGPLLRGDVAEVLFGSTRVITVDMTVADAVESYRRFAFGV